MGQHDGSDGKIGHGGDLLPRLGGIVWRELRVDRDHSVIACDEAGVRAAAGDPVGAVSQIVRLELDLGGLRQGGERDVQDQRGRDASSCPSHLKLSLSAEAGRWQSGPASLGGPFHDEFGIARADDRIRRERAVQFGKLIRGERNVERRHVVDDPGRSADAGKRNDVVTAREHPGKREFAPG